MSAWLKRFGLHMAAAIGATGIFVAAAAVGANQTRQQAATLASTQRNLRWLVIGAAAVLGILWIKNGGLSHGGGLFTLGLILIGLLTAWVLGRRRR